MTGTDGSQGDARVAELVAAARAVRANAYAPYSGFRVGAAIRLTNGTILTGCNLENASYGLSLCAEAVALGTANALGQMTQIAAIAIAGNGEAPVLPCGRCRQMLVEAEHVAGREISIYCAGATGEAISRHAVSALLPHAFGPASPGIEPAHPSGG